MKNCACSLRPAVVLFASLSLLTGIVYPLAMTAIGRIAFAKQSAGSLIEVDGKIAGSQLIGQPFDAPGYFWGRLSATTPMPYNAQSSSGSNLGPTNPALHDAVKARLAALRAADPNGAGRDARRVPVDLVTASASGLDPEISPAAADYQAPRVAQTRGLPLAEVQRLIAAHTRGRQFGILGEARINVLELNLALDQASGFRQQRSN